MVKYLSLLAALLLSLAGCASSDREPMTSYDRNQVGTVQQVETGRIVSLTPVEIEGNESKVGTVIGAIAGGLAGRQVGSGSGRDVATVAGAVAGGYAGSRISDKDADGVEIGIKLDDGREISIVQELDEGEVFSVGEQVSVVYNGNKAHVEH